jgi:hypothetical protein
MDHSAWQKREKEENRRLRRLLGKVLRQAGLPPGDGRSLQILNLACGECREAETLVQVAADVQATTVSAAARPSAPPEIRLVGADIREREIQHAAERFASRKGVAFEFLAGDASQLSHHGQIGGAFDLTFLRHQNYWHDPRLWRRIFAQGLEKLRDDGLLVITSYFDKEHALATAALEKAGAELVLTERHDQSIALATPGKSVDRHVAVFRKKR